MLTDKRTKKPGQTNRRNYTNFERNLTMMMIYLPVKFEFDRTMHFRVENGDVDRQTNRLKMDKRTDGITTF